MVSDMAGFNPSVMQANTASLRANPYPGRGIVLGLSTDDAYAVQVYWVMGRSDNSRNRVLVEDKEGVVRTEAFDPSRVQDPSLIIYNAMRSAPMESIAHVVSNG